MSPISGTALTMSTPKYEEIAIADFPLLQQLDNELYPNGSCNATSMAMCAKFFGVKPAKNRGYSQLEDQFLAEFDASGRDRHDPAMMAQVLRECGVRDELFIVEGWDKVGEILYGRLIPHLKNQKPAIAHTYLTHGGHIVCIGGVRLRDGSPVSWLIFDPYGEFFPSYYDKNYGGDREKGKYWLSHDEFTRSVLTGGVFWLHLVSKN